MYQRGDVCGATASPTHPLVSDVIMVEELFLFLFLSLQIVPVCPVTAQREQSCCFHFCSEMQKEEGPITAQS